MPAVLAAFWSNVTVYSPPAAFAQRSIKQSAKSAFESENRRSACPMTSARSTTNSLVLPPSICCACGAHAGTDKAWLDIGERHGMLQLDRCPAAAWYWDRPTREGSDSGHCGREADHRAIAPRLHHDVQRVPPGVSTIKRHGQSYTPRAKNGPGLPGENCNRAPLLRPTAADGCACARASVSSACRCIFSDRAW